MEHGITMILVLKQSLIDIKYKYENIFKKISLIYSRCPVDSLKILALLDFVCILSLTTLFIVQH